MNDRGKHHVGAAESLAVMTRELRIRVLNCSLSGVLFESDASLSVGTVAVLGLRIGNRDFKDDIRVVRCRPIPGAGGRYQIAAELLWTAMPGQQSLRLAMQQRLAPDAEARAQS